MLKIGERYKTLRTYVVVEGDEKETRREIPPQSILTVVAVKDGFTEVESDKGIKMPVPDKYVNGMDWVAIQNDNL